jgi:hypothetical protein
MARDFILQNNTDLRQAFQEISRVLKITKMVKITASSMRSKTSEQLGYYWAVILPAITEHLNETGVNCTKSDVNEVLNHKFFYKEIVVDNEMIRVPKSKSGATKEQMQKFIDDVLLWATEIGVFIPPPSTEVFDTENVNKTVL